MQYRKVCISLLVLNGILLWPLLHVRSRCIEVQSARGHERSILQESTTRSEHIKNETVQDRASPQRDQNDFTTPNAVLRPGSESSGGYVVSDPLLMENEKYQALLVTRMRCNIRRDFAPLIDLFALKDDDRDKLAELISSCLIEQLNITAISDQVEKTDGKRPNNALLRRQALDEMKEAIASSFGQEVADEAVFFYQNQSLRMSPLYQSLLTQAALAGDPLAPKHVQVLMHALSEVPSQYDPSSTSFSLPASALDALRGSLTPTQSAILVHLNAEASGFNRIKLPRRGT